MTEHGQDTGSSELDRWEALMDREAVGEELTEAEQEFCASFELENPEAAAERSAWASMLDGLEAESAQDPELDQTRALADAVLHQHRREHARASAPIAATPPGGRLVRLRRRRVALAGAGVALVAAAAAVVLFAFPNGLAPDELAPSGVAAAPTEDAPHGVDGPKATEGVDGTRDSAGSAVSRDGRLALATRSDSLPFPLGSAATLDDAMTPQGRTCLVFREPWATACFDGGSRYTVRGEGLETGARELALESGRVVVTLDEVGPGRRFSVTTDAGTVTAVGTVFSVTYTEGGVLASVLEGEVAVTEPGVRPGAADALSLVAGKSHRLGEELIVAIDPDQQSHMHQVDLLAQMWRTPDLGLLEVQSSPGARALLGDQSLGEVPVSALVQLGSHQLAVASQSGRDTAATTVEITRDRRSQVELPLARTIGSKATPVTAAVLAQRAQKARRAKSYDETARLYRQLVKNHPRSPEARNAQVRLGDLLQDHLGDPEGALGAYNAYLEGGGSLAPEARWGRIRALRALGRKVEEKAAIDSFLRHHGDDFRAEELRGMR